MRIFKKVTLILLCCLIVAVANLTIYNYTFDYADHLRMEFDDDIYILNPLSTISANCVNVETTGKYDVKIVGYADISFMEEDMPQHLSPAIEYILPAGNKGVIHFVDSTYDTKMESFQPIYITFINRDASWAIPHRVYFLDELSDHTLDRLLNDEAVLADCTALGLLTWFVNQTYVLQTIIVVLIASVIWVLHSVFIKKPADIVFFAAYVLLIALFFFIGQLCIIPNSLRHILLGMLFP